MLALLAPRVPEVFTNGPRLYLLGKGDERYTCSVTPVQPPGTFESRPVIVHECVVVGLSGDMRKCMGEQNR